MTTSNQSNQCGFLKLPSDVRKHIYEFTLVDNEAINILRHAQSTAKTCPKKSVFMPEPGLLATCTKIRKEALPIFYANNIFGYHFQDSLYMQAPWKPFVAKLSPNKRSMLRYVRIRPDNRGIGFSLARAKDQQKILHRWKRTLCLWKCWLIGTRTQVFCGLITHWGVELIMTIEMC